MPSGSDVVLCEPDHAPTLSRRAVGQPAAAGGAPEAALRRQRGRRPPGRPRVGDARGVLTYGGDLRDDCPLVRNDRMHANGGAAPRLCVREARIVRHSDRPRDASPGRGWRGAARRPGGCNRRARLPCLPGIPHAVARRREPRRKRAGRGHRGSRLVSDGRQWLPGRRWLLVRDRAFQGNHQTRRRDDNALGH